MRIAGATLLLITGVLLFSRSDSSPVPDPSVPAVEVPETMQADVDAALRNASTDVVAKYAGWFEAISWSMGSDRQQRELEADWVAARRRIKLDGNVMSEVLRTHVNEDDGEPQKTREELIEVYRQLAAACRSRLR